jgi:murein DD-endopeptidase MepM/ murein hydrolase activator NlpD
MLYASPSVAADPATREAPQGECRDCSLSENELVFESGDSLATLLDSVGVGPAVTLRVAEALESIVDPGAIPPGARMTVRLTADEDAPEQQFLQRLTLNSQLDRSFVVRRTPNGGYTASVRKQKHERSVEVEILPIETSLYASAMEAEASVELMLRAQRILGTRVDLQRSLRRGDRVTIVYERLDHPQSTTRHAGKLLAVTLEQRTRKTALYRFEQGDQYTQFFDKNGASVQLTLIRNPVRQARLTSSFGRREHPILGYERMHEGLDYAASRGARVVAAGSGRVGFAGRNGSYGQYVRIEHEDGLSTAYAHLSRIADGIQPGRRISQGETIGYVGQTGLATGPNLHYEVRRNGAPVNPAELDLPARRTLQGRTLKTFQAQRERIHKIISRRLDDYRDDSLNIALTVDSPDSAQP